MELAFPSSALSLASRVEMLSLALLERISRTRLRPRGSTAAPALLAFHASNAESLPWREAQSASVRVFFWPIKGLTAVVANVPIALDQAGFTPSCNGKALS